MLIFFFAPLDATDWSTEKSSVKLLEAPIPMGQNTSNFTNVIHTVIASDLHYYDYTAFREVNERKDISNIKINISRGKKI